VTDYVGWSDYFTPQERQLQETVRTFVQQEFLPRVVECHRSCRFPMDLVPRMGELGLFGVPLQGYGCPGKSAREYGLVMLELERGDSSLRTMASVQGALGMYAIHRYGSEEQKQYWLPRLARGEALTGFALTEPNHGSDPAGMQARVRKIGDTYVLTGEKKWIGNAGLADIVVVWAKDEDGTISGFLVDPKAEGCTTTLIEGKFSLRIAQTYSMRFQECVVPLENRLPHAVGLKTALDCLSQARFGIVWGVLGAATDCYETALKYVKSRAQFGKPLGAFQLVQEKLVWMLTEITKGQLLALQLAHLKEQGRLRPQQISLAKRNNVWMALQCARMARDILGAVGITDEYSVIRHMLNLESVYTYEGTHDIHTLIVGADITGTPAFS